MGYSQAATQLCNMFTLFTLLSTTIVVMNFYTCEIFFTRSTVQTLVLCTESSNVYLRLQHNVYISSK